MSVFVKDSGEQKETRRSERERRVGVGVGDMARIPTKAVPGSAAEAP